MNNEIIIYNSGEIELKVSIDNQNETVWLRQSEISKLFNKERSVITRHINKIFRDEEVDEKSNVQKIHIANSDKPVKLDIEKYNLQYQNLTIQTSNKYHDRFLIIDNQTYHIGASLKDLGKKVFGFSKMNINILGALNG